MADARYQDEWDCGCAWNWLDDIFIMCPMHKSAPDLLEALEAITKRHEGWEHGLGPCVCEAHEQARATIAKAKEETG